MTSTEFKNTITERMKAVRHLSPTEKQKTRRYLLRMTRCEICESIVEENYRYRNQKGEICEDVICYECETERGVPRWVWKLPIYIFGSVINPSKANLPKTL